MTSTVAEGAPETLSGLVRRLAAEAPDAPAVTCGPTTSTRGELLERAERLATAYADLGVGPRDVVAIALPNGIEFVAASLAVWILGASPLPLSWRFPLAERQGIVELAEARLVVGVEPDEHEGRVTLPAGYDPSGHDRWTAEPDDLSASFQITTSGGSTGRPKLIVSDFSLEMAATILPALSGAMGVTADGVVLVPTPLYHGAGFQFTWGGLAIGAHVVLLPKFEPAAALKAIDRNGVTWAFTVPTILSRMLKVIDEEPRRFDLSSLRSLWHSAGPCPAWVKERWIELIGAEKVMELYGAGEGAVGAMISGTEWLQHRGSVGRPVGGEVRILDDDGNEVPAGEVGEIWMRPQEGAPKKAHLVGAEMRSRDGWTSVGDLGRLDEDGYLYISDRRVDMIVSGGANVFPAEVEAALLQHPSVLSAIVVGLPDDDLGQRVHAVVQASDVSEEEVLAFLGERLVRYKVPRSVRFVDQPLQDDAGKARRSAFRDEEVARMGLTTGG